MCGEVFPHGVVGALNVLPDDEVEAGTLPTFMRHLDGYMNREEIEGYRPSKGRRIFLVRAS